MKVNWWKWGVLIAIAAALFYGGWRCGSGSVKPATRDTATVRIDTLPGKIEVVIDTQYVPRPYKVVEYKVDSSGHANSGNKIPLFDSSQLLQIMKDYEASRYYSDTIPIDHGTAVINDTVSQNRITGRSVKTTLQIPTVRETVTLYQPKRNIVYLGVNVQGGPQNYLFAAGADLSLKTKNDRIYSAGVSLTMDNQVLYQGGIRFPIRLRIFDRR